MVGGGRRKVSFDEHLLCIAHMLVGGVVWAYLIGVLTSIVTSLDRHGNNFKQVVRARVPLSQARKAREGREMNGKKNRNLRVRAARRSHSESFVTRVFVTPFFPSSTFWRR